MPYTPTYWFPNESSGLHYAFAIGNAVFAIVILLLIVFKVFKPNAIWDPILMSIIGVLSAIGVGVNFALALRVPPAVSPTVEDLNVQ